MTADAPGVFISYRRKEASSHADRLHDRLAARLGEDRVFMDVDSIKPGENWIEAISNALAKCGLMLVLIGDQWGQARSDRDAPTGDTDDYVRLEIDAAFDRGIPVIPVLLEEAVMPRHADLPDTLVKLSNLQAIRVRHDTFRSDAVSLLKVVEDVLDAYEDEGNSSRAHSVVNNILAPPHDKTDASPTGADQGLRDGEIGAGQGGRTAGAGSAAMRPEPVEGRGRSEHPLREPGPRPGPGRARRLLVPLLTLVSLVAVGFATWIFTSTTRTDPAAGEEIAEAIGTAVNPFLEGVGQDVPQPPPPKTAGPVRGDTAGLYGGTRRGAICDAAKLVAFLETHPDKGAAWAGVLKLNLQQIHPFVARLTPLILRADTRVTNHGFEDGRVTSFSSILQAGTAVLVDKQGVPVVKCFCGNPLTLPRPVAQSYQGKPWPGFDAERVIVIKPAPAPIKSFTVVDHTTGKKFSKKTGAKVPPPNPEQPTAPQSASLSPPATSGTADTTSPTSVPPSTADPTTESEPASPTESETADHPTGGDSADGGESDGTDSSREGGDSEGSSGPGQTEGNGNGETQAETDNQGETDNQTDTRTNGGVGTNPDTGEGTNGSPGPS